MDKLFLDRNENAYGPAPECYVALRQAGIDALSTYSRCFTEGYASDLSRRLARDAGLSESQVILGYGSEDLLKQIVHCYVPMGGTVLVPALSWWYYKALASEVGGVCTSFALRDDGTRFAYDADEIIRAYDRQRPEVILIASPNNPTGNAISESDFERVVHHCTSSVIVVDQAYHGFSKTPEISIAGTFAVHPRTVFVRTFSKLYALAGMRIGYAFAGPDLRSLVRFSARYLGYNRLSEQVAIAALDNPAYYRDVAENISRDREAVASALRKDGGRPYASEANFVLARVPAEHLPAFRQSFLERNIVIKFFEEAGLEHSVRISIGTGDHSRRVLDAIESARTPSSVTTTARSTV